MQSIDLSKVRLLTFNAYYIALAGLYLLICSTVETRFFPDPDYPVTSGLFIGLGVQFCILGVRIILMQKKLHYSGEIQIVSTIISILINLVILLYLAYSEKNFSLMIGFFIAHNLNILNIAFITNLSVKKND